MGGVMTSRTRYRGAVLLILAAGFGLASALQAGAQAVSREENTEADAALDINDVDMMDVDIKNLDWSQLNVDASTLISPASKVRAAPPRAGTDMSWSSQDKPNGSAAVSVKQPLSPFWDTRIGADMTVGHQPQTFTRSGLVRKEFSSDSQPSQSSGSAWAAITAPGVASIWDKTAVEARVDPSQEQSKLGTSLSKSLPLNEQYSLTLQNGYNVVQQGHSSLSCADCVHLSAVPVPGITGHPVRNYETEQSAKLSIADTGTSFIAGQTLSSADDKWLRKIGAEQKLFGDVSISGSIGESAQGTATKSLTAGFKHSW